MRTRIQEKFGLNVSKSIAYYNMQKMKFHILCQDQSIINKIKVDRKNLRKFNEITVSILDNSYFSWVNHVLAHIQKLSIGNLKRALECMVKVKLDRQNFYLYSAVDPRNGESFSLFVLNVNTDYMNIFLEQIL